MIGFGDNACSAGGAGFSGGGADTYAVWIFATVETCPLIAAFDYKDRGDKVSVSKLEIALENSNSFCWQDCTPNMEAWRGVLRRRAMGRREFV